MSSALGTCIGWLRGWFDNHSLARASHHTQLVLTALLSGGIVAATIVTFQSDRRRRLVALLKASIPEAEQDPIATKISGYDAKHAVGNAAGNIAGVDQASTNDMEDERSARLAARARHGDYDEDLILEQLARNRVFLTDEGLRKLRDSFVIVVGCGGVGSHATAALARSGVSKLRLIDFDQISLSSLNRHAVATLADVGTPKVTCLRKRLEQIAPWVHFDCRKELFGKNVAAQQLQPWNGGSHAPNFVIDAIDNIESKVDLLKYCHDQSLPVISSMGAGCKSDPTRIFIGDISTSTDDPLSKSTRRRLRMQGVATGIPVVYSTEKPGPGKAQLLPLPEDEFQKGEVGELSVLPDFRVRILPVLGTMPAVFGMCIANHVMLALTGYPHDYAPLRSRDKMCDGILASLQGQEERIQRAKGCDVLGLRLPVTAEDVGYIVVEVYRGRSVVSGLTTRLALTRWRFQDANDGRLDDGVPGQKFVRLSLRDLVCMTKEEAARHEKEILIGGRSPEDMYDRRTVALVEQRMEEEALYSMYR